MAGPDDQDTTRRDFFRTFGRETVRQAGAVAGAAAELRRSSLAAARVLFDPEAETTDQPAEPIDAINAIEPNRPDATFRSAYRFTGSEIIALDARQLPDRVTTVALTQPSEVASAIRSSVINGGPVLAEVGAYAMALAARAVIGRPDNGRVQQIRAAANTLRFARPEIHALAWSIDRLEGVYDDLAGQATDPIETADRLQSEADSIASEATTGQAEIGRIGAGVILATSDEPLNLLIHGDMGPLSCGMVGMGTALIQAIRDRGREIHVWVTAAAPVGEGGRVTAFSLRQLDVPYTVIPDTAVGWLFANRHVDALLLRGDRVAENGDCGVLIGGLSAAVLAATAQAPVYVLAPRSAFEPVRHGAEMRAGDAPTSDVVGANLITRVISEAAN
jgi:methylthioribose-1-phosphate isomerase